MSRPSTVPLLEVDPRFVRRKKIIRIVSIVTAVVLLIALVVLIHSCVVARGIREDLATASELSCLDTIEAHQKALQLVDGLYEDYPDHEKIRARYAWQHFLTALRVGPVGEHVKAARGAVEAAGEGPQPAILAAAKIGLDALEGDATAAATRAHALLEQAETCRECGLVYAYALMKSGRSAEAGAILDAARRGQPPFIPALAMLTETLRRQGRYAEARNALTLMTKLAPNHQGTVVEQVLVAIGDASASGGEPTKLAASLAPRLAAVKIDDAHPRRALIKHFADGRLAYLSGNDDAAVAAFGAALTLDAGHQDSATWRAKALRRAGKQLAALESLRAYPDEAGTDVELLLTRSAILMDLHKTRDAAAPIDVLVQSKVKGAALLEGRRLYRQGEFQKASVLLRTAATRGYLQANLQLAEIYVAGGDFENATKVLEATTTGGAIASCAKGLRHYYDGRFKRAHSAFTAATKAGGRCGASLAGRLLVGAGMDEELRGTLGSALETREDLRDRVALGRLTYRVEGQVAAKRQLDQVRQLSPQGALVLAELSEAYEDIGLVELAFEVAQEGIEGSEQHPRLFAIAARIARELDRYDDARQLVERGLKASSTHQGLLVEKTANLVAARRYPIADQFVEKALSQGEYFSEAACLQAEIEARRGDRRGSQIQLAKLLHYNRRTVPFVELAPARFCLADSYIRRGRASYGKARANMGILRRRGVLWPEIEYTLGLLSDRRNRDRRAVGEYRDALELDPTHRPSWDMLARHDELDADDLARFQSFYPGQTPGRRR